MNKEERIKKYGKEKYEKYVNQGRGWAIKHPEEIREYKRKWERTHPEEAKESTRRWVLANPDKVKGYSRGRKGSKYYDQKMQYRMTGIQHEKDLVRAKHRRIWTPFKKIIAPASQIHHEWVPKTPDYRGVALVEKNQHMRGFIDIIQILEGEITLFAEPEIKTEVQKHLQET